jgi:hypothetical protein
MGNGWHRWFVMTAWPIGNSRGRFVLVFPQPIIDMDWLTKGMFDMLG